ncbi:PREDICTED: kinesin-like protein KIN-8A [Tarenaya hassleriana]|uniref:kinesin-like protein KIN-8A n=1 Tax=Tarenaya hassleriana TaxID=28532 RepID=UPI00053C1C2E|nr:PREDICTED: kinesin-like protein KIN-8A [Tarenaya hassleriana]
MPVSTRSKVLRQEQNEQENANSTLPMRNPHQGLKEKMRALTLLYEQQKRASFALRNPNQSPKHEEQRFTTHPSIELLDSCRKGEKGLGNEVKNSNLEHNTMRENDANTTATRNLVLSQPHGGEEAKENNVIMDIDRNVIVGADRITSYPKKRESSSNVMRKLSMGASVQQNPDQDEVNGANNVTQVDKVEKTENFDENGSRILVFLRLRPMAKKEKEAGSRCCVKIVNKRDVYLTEYASENDYLRLKRLRGRHFTFDASFPETTTQQEVYSTTTSALVEAVLQGRNGSVFCYGATGAGKTYTMLGTVDNPGVMVLAIKDLFAKVRQRSVDGNHVVHLSYLEVYNETVRDLLSPGRPLVLREDKQGIVAAGLTQYRAYSTDEVMVLLQRGNQNRTTEPTRANETSSRSHAILQVMVEYRTRDASMSIINRIGKLSLIDLAGSERALATDQRTLRSLEGANINRSLLALSSCINALVEGKKHIPYRNSKLTQLLKDSLGGACNTVMIANISPSNHSFGETQNTLHWADRAKEIRTKGCETNEEVVQVSEPGSGQGPDQAKLLFEVQKENRELRVQLAKQHQKLLTLQAQSLAANNIASMTPPSVTSLMTPPSTAQPNEKRKPRPSFLSGTCFTPESKRRKAEETVKELQLTVKSLKMEMERMKKEHTLEIKKKDELIRDLSRKREITPGRTREPKRVITRGEKKKNDPSSELKSPSHRFKSPLATTAKKRSFWDITVGNSPSLNGRKTRSHVVLEASASAAPSMLLQPGFARPTTRF